MKKSRNLLRTSWLCMEAIVLSPLSIFPQIQDSGAQIQGPATSTISLDPLLPQQISASGFVLQLPGPRGAKRLVLRLVHVAELAPQVVDGATQQARDVHLADADGIGDLG